MMRSDHFFSMMFDNFQRVVSCLFLIASLIWVGWFLSPFHTPRSLEDLKDFKPSSILQVSGGDRDALREVYLARVQAFREALHSVDLLLLAFVVLVLLTSHFLSGTAVRAPIVDIEIPHAWMSIVLALAVTILWVRFGYFLSSLIDTRLCLWQLGAALEPGVEVAKNKDIAIPVASMRPLLDDWGIIEGLVVRYHPEYSYHRLQHHGVIDGFLICMSVILGLANACPLVCMVRQGQISGSRSVRACCVIVFAVCGMTVLVTHAQFSMAQPLGHVLQPVSVLTTAVATTLGTFIPFRGTSRGGALRALRVARHLEASPRRRARLEGELRRACRPRKNAPE